MARALTADEQLKLNYLCFLEWNDNLDNIRTMVASSRARAARNHRVYIKRRDKKKPPTSKFVFVDPDGVQHTMTPLVDYPITPVVDYSSASASSIKTSSSEGSPREAAERVRKFLVTPNPPPYYPPSPPNFCPTDE